MLLKPSLTKENVVLSTYRLTKMLRAKVTLGYIKDKILSHPDYKSMLAMSDTLQSCNIATLSGKIDQHKLKTIPGSFITQRAGKGWENFVVVTDISDTTIGYYNAKDQYVKMPFDQFVVDWTGACLFAETNESSGEEGYTKKRIASNTLNIGTGVLLLCLLGWIGISFYKQINIEPASQLLLATYFMIKVLGVVASGLLLWYEIDKHNPVLQKICSGGKKVNCDAVLNSKQATFLYNTFSWSEIGFAYFFGTSVFLLLQGFSSGALTITGWVSLLSIPIIISSFIYQGVILKQWCKLCIAIQGALAVEIVLIFFTNWYTGSLDFMLLPSFIALLVLPILSWKLLKPILERSKESNFYKRNFLQLKNNLDVFTGLLHKSRKIQYPTDGMGIIFNSENAKYAVIKVCNPYCGPCADAHPILEELVEKEVINLQILFTASTDPKDYKAKPVRHFLAVDNQGDKQQTQHALDDWYLAEKKDYETFASKYPMNGELEEQMEKIKVMRTWCDKEKITHTPTIFINGYELPSEYKIEDLKDILI